MELLLFVFKKQLKIGEGEEWDHYSGLETPAEELRMFLESVPFGRSHKRRHRAAWIDVPPRFESPDADKISTQKSILFLIPFWKGKNIQNSRSWDPPNP